MLTRRDRLQRSAAALAVAVGAGLLGTAVGGMADVDADLRAATTAPPAFDARMVAGRPAPEWRGGECPEDDDRDAAWREL